MVSLAERNQKPVESKQSILKVLGIKKYEDLKRTWKHY
jgi:hypothetical protein